MIYRLLFFVCLFVRLRISSPKIKLAASNFARWIIGVLGRECTILGNFAVPEAQNRTNRPATGKYCLRCISLPYRINVTLQMRRLWNIALRVDVRRHVWIRSVPTNVLVAFYLNFLCIIHFAWYVRNHTAGDVRNDILSISSSISDNMQVY